MKELSIEQKAKRYDEAIEVARKIKDGEFIKVPDGTVIPVAIFPELNENKDEMIKTAILNHLKIMWGNCQDNVCGVHVEDAIDWLEKQSEKKPYERKDFISIPFGTDSELIEEIIRIPKGYVAAIEGNKIHIKKKDKSATEAIKSNYTVDNNEMVEPNFKAGDWVVRTDGENFCNGSKFAQITKIDNWKYWLDSNSWVKAMDIRLWSIKDAQDGDVLMCPKYAGDIIPNIFIFKDIDINNDVSCYCAFLKIFFATGGYIASADSINTDFYPATKEQCDLLFQKMKESGYEWNADKKELKNLIKHL